MKHFNFKHLFLLAILFTAFAGCQKDSDGIIPDPIDPVYEAGKYENGFFLIHEGWFGHGTGSVSFYNYSTGEITDSLYNLDYVLQKDKYSLFLNNLHTLIEITNENAESDRELVLIKDSYANSMVPFLTHHFQKIYVFDTRYYKQGPSSFIEDHPSVTDVLLLYNMNTLDSDSGIRGIY